MANGIPTNVIFGKISLYVHVCVGRPNLRYEGKTETGVKVIAISISFCFNSLSICIEILDVSFTLVAITTDGHHRLDHFLRIKMQQIPC